MGDTWEGLLDTLVNGVDRMPWRDDNERRDAEIENMRFVLQSVIERLRDQDRAPPADGAKNG